MLLTRLILVSLIILYLIETLSAENNALKGGSAKISITGRGSLPLRAKNGAVATGNTICNEIGVDVLKEGGNAVDAAIAAAICLGARNCFASGIGGGTFALKINNNQYFC